jgi:hypothetical protein
MPGWRGPSATSDRGLVTMGSVRGWLRTPPLPTTTGHRDFGVQNGVNTTPVPSRSCTVRVVRERVFAAGRILPRLIRRVAEYRGGNVKLVRSARGCSRFFGGPYPGCD